MAVNGGNGDEMNVHSAIEPGDGVHVTGTLVWYYYICQRQVWLMARQITPDEDHPSLELGRFIHDHSYEREKKELTVGHLKVDVVKHEHGQLVVGETKKSSRYRKSARMQLLFYLDELRMRGVNARGELCFPQEKRKERVELTDADIKELDSTRREILRIVYLAEPPAPKRIDLCRGCGYREFCWC